MITLGKVLLNLLFALLICVVILFISSTAISTRVPMSILCFGGPYPSWLYLCCLSAFLVSVLGESDCSILKGNMAANLNSSVVSQYRASLCTACTKVTRACQTVAAGLC